MSSIMGKTIKKKPIGTSKSPRNSTNNDPFFSLQLTHGRQKWTINNCFWNITQQSKKWYMVGEVGGGHENHNRRKKTKTKT